MNNSVKVHQCVEALCNNGCEAVRATIGALESGQDIKQTEGMEQDEREAVLRELQAIMAVYDR